MAPVDLIVVFVKAMFSESALNNNRSIIGPETYLMTLQNGSGHEDMLGKFVPQEHIIIGTTQHNASVAGFGVTKHGGSGMTHMGCVTGDVKRLQKFADAFTACGLDADVSDGVQKMIWNKMFTNVSASALTGALQVPLGFISADEHAWQLCCQLIREAVDVAAALGMDFDYDEKVAEVKAVCDKSPNGLPEPPLPGGPHPCDGEPSESISGWVPDVSIVLVKMYGGRHFHGSIALVKGSRAARKCRRTPADKII